MESGEPVVTYCDIQDGWPSGIDNISSDPCFISFDPNGAPELWDFHLRSAYGRWDPNIQEWVKDSHTSPCIDGGDPNSNWNAEPWPNGKRINIGAYGGTNKASMNGNAADFNIDWAVNLVDFVQLANKWLDEGSYIEDLNSDEIIDFFDLGTFVDNWLWKKE